MHHLCMLIDQTMVSSLRGPRLNGLPLSTVFPMEARLQERRHCRVLQDPSTSENDAAIR